MKNTIQAFSIIATFGVAALAAQPGMASERWQDPNACYIEAATFNIATLERLEYKEAQKDYPTILGDMTKTLADDPCIDIHHLGTEGAGRIAANILSTNLLETPADLLIYAQLGSNPYNAYVRSAYEPVRPSLYTCDVDPHYTLEALDGIRADAAKGLVSYPQAYGKAAVVIWHDGCAIAHISPANILATTADLLDTAHAGEATSAIVASHFAR